MKYKLYISIFLIFCSCYQLKSQVQAYFTADTIIGCGSLVVSFTDTSSGSGINSWQWDFDSDGNVDSYLQNPTTFPYSPGTYTVKLTVSNGVDSDVIIKTNYIIVREMPIANFSFENSDFYNNSFSVLFTDQSTYISGYEYSMLWDFNDGTVLTTDSSRILHIFSSEGSFLVIFEVSDDIGCADSISIPVVVEDKLLVPNVFTPNGDGINDIFSVVTNGETVYEFVVYSRWGMILYKSIGTQIMWDGRTSAGETLFTGTYFYTINSVSEDRKVSKSGTLQLAITK